MLVNCGNMKLLTRPPQKREHAVVIRKRHKTIYFPTLERVKTTFPRHVVRNKSGTINTYGKTCVKHAKNAVTFRKRLQTQKVIDELCASSEIRSDTKKNVFRT